MKKIYLLADEDEFKKVKKLLGENGYIVEKWKQEYDLSKFPKVEGIWKARKAKQLKKRKAFLEAFLFLKENNEETTINKISKISRLHWETARKYYQDYKDNDIETLKRELKRIDKELKSGNNKNNSDNN